MEIAIAGAGLVGRLLGWQLTKMGSKVDVFECCSRAKPKSAAHVSASMLAPLSEYPDSLPGVYDMSLDSLQVWPSFLDELGVAYGLNGSIVVAHTQDLSLLNQFERVLRRDSLPGVNRVSSSELEELEPELASRFSEALYLESEGWLDNRGLLSALEDRCGKIHYEVDVDPSYLRSDLVIDCRGSGSNDSELRGVRGEVIRVHAPEVHLTRPIRLMHPRYQIYISPRPGQTYVIGATELENNSTSGLSIRSALELLSAAHTVHSGFAEAEILELGVGVRAAYPDNLPRIYWRDGILSINGLYRHGYLIAPTLVNDAIREIGESWNSRLTAIS